MTGQAHIDPHQALLYMHLMRELAPILRDAAERADAAYSAARDAKHDLETVKRQIDLLDDLSRIEEYDPATVIREVMRADVIVRTQMRESFVYFIEAGDYIKIGQSRDPIVRLGQIRKGDATTKPQGLDTSKARLLAIEEGSFAEERKLHHQFSVHRVEGEWFRKNERLTHYIQSVATAA